jgi:hypothetical protein
MGSVQAMRLFAQMASGSGHSSTSLKIAPVWLCLHTGGAGEQGAFEKRKLYMRTLRSRANVHIWCVVVGLLG